MYNLYFASIYTLVAMVVYATCVHYDIIWLSQSQSKKKPYKKFKTLVLNPILILTLTLVLRAG